MVDKLFGFLLCFVVSFGNCVKLSIIGIGLLICINVVLVLFQFMFLLGYVRSFPLQLSRAKIRMTIYRGCFLFFLKP